MRKLYSTCRCISEFLVNQNPTVEIGSISCHDFLVNQNPKLYPDRFRGLVHQNPKSSDVAEFLVQDGFSDSSFSVQKKEEVFVASSYLFNKRLIMSAVNTNIISYFYRFVNSFIKKINIKLIIFIFFGLRLF